MSQQEVTGTLLHAGFVYDDGLLLDLYGTPKTADDGFLVEGVMLRGSKVDITQLFSQRQLTNMGYWLDLKDGNAAQKAWAESYRHASVVPR